MNERNLIFMLFMLNIFNITVNIFIMHDSLKSIETIERTTKKVDNIGKTLDSIDVKIKQHEQ